MLICLSATAQSPEPWYNTTYVNANKPGSTYRFSFVHVTDTHIGEGIGDYGTEGLDDEPPVGDVGYSAERLRTFVNWVNDHYEAEGIEFVLVSGDLTDSGERSEFLKFKEIMDALDIPYIPLIGNHDVWPYNDDTVGTRPNGDSLINTIFETVFDDAALFFDDWDDGSRLEYTWNEEAGRYNYLQNFYAFYKGFHFLFMDFNPRYPAARNEPGIGPEAQIMDFEHGTWQWVRARMQQLEQLGDQNTFLISHHPPSNDLWSFYNAFTQEEKLTMMDFLFNYKNHLAVWLAGHIHRNMVYYSKTVSLQPYNVILCAETEANKEIDQSAFRLMKVYESGISTAVSDHMIAKGLDIYPNPGQGLFRIFWKGNHDKFLKATIHDNTGRLISNSTLNMEGTSYQFTLDAHGLRDGIYHLMLENSEGAVSQIVVIQ